jgi:hypothetical protein
MSERGEVIADHRRKALLGNPRHVLLQSILAEVLVRLMSCRSLSPSAHITSCSPISPTPLNLPCIRLLRSVPPILWLPVPLGSVHCMPMCDEWPGPEIRQAQCKRCVHGSTSGKAHWQECSKLLLVRNALRLRKSFTLPVPLVSASPCSPLYLSPPSLIHMHLTHLLRPDSTRNYNTLESVLLFCAVLVNLAGVMFESGRFEIALYNGQRDFLTWAVVLIIILSVS